ncbi:N-acetylglucosamine-6-phosphate deacetylase [Candidatus Atribacteria bacterium 1244-E10-H5-B2]|nr:MAG: N-acetylglucosamine-6-phosphate deacetylase [Candidatus Atribacteria bacterium 1244-E10-H5-B2]
MVNPIALINGTLITPFREIEQGCVLIKGEFIEKIGKVDEVQIPNDAKVIDVGGMYISPGFIDSHLHGAFGGSVMPCSEKDLQLMAQGLVKCGTTSFLPTTLSRPWDEIIQSVDCITQAMQKDLKGSKILGIHLEGPYVNLEQKGAQNPKYICPPQPEQYLPLLEKYPSIIRLTAAPEVPGGLELGQELRKRKIVATIGHSNATYQQVIEAVENGYTHVTHMFSGMSGLRRIKAYRVSGVIESTLLIDELTTELIADGHHLPPSLMKLVFHSKGMDKVCLVTDSMNAAGMGPGKYELAGLEVIVEADIPEEFEIPTQENNWVAKLTDRSSFASSVSTIDRLVRNMIKFVDLNIRQAVKLVTYNPAKIQGLEDQIGILAKNKKADIAVFDDNINIEMTIVDGRILYESLKY